MIFSRPSLPPSHSLSILTAQQPHHLRPRQVTIPDCRARPLRRAGVVDQLHAPSSTLGDLQNRTARVLRTRDQLHHCLDDLLHGDPLALAHPGLTLRPERRQHTSRRDGDDAHALGRFEGGHGFHEVVQTRFRGRVERDRGAGLLCGAAGEHEHSSGRGEAGEGVQGELRAADGVVEVDFQDFVGGGGGCGIGAGFEGPEVGGGLDMRLVRVLFKRRGGFKTWFQRLTGSEEPAPVTTRSRRPKVSRAILNAASS